MSKETHYSYQSEITLDKEKLKQDSDIQIPISVNIKSVKFMVPIHLEFELVNTITEEIVGEPFSIGGGIDIANQELSLGMKFPDQVADQIKKNVFKYIFDQSILEEDKFEAKSDVYEQAERAQKEHDNLQEQNLGGDNV